MFEGFETSRSDGVRQVNRARVMRLIQDKSGIDRTELASLIGVSNAAITNIVNELIAANIVQETISSGDSVAVVENGLVCKLTGPVDLCSALLQLLRA